MRAKVDGDYKNPNATPKTIKVKDQDNKEKEIQEMEIICTDYPLKIPMILYNCSEAHDVNAGKPMIVFKGDLYGIYNFTQVGKVKGQFVINIFVLYAGDPKISSITKV